MSSFGRHSQVDSEFGRCQDPVVAPEAAHAGCLARRTCHPFEPRQTHRRETVGCPCDVATHAPGRGQSQRRGGYDMNPAWLAPSQDGYNGESSIHPRPERATRRCHSPRSRVGSPEWRWRRETRRSRAAPCAGMGHVGTAWRRPHPEFMSSSVTGAARGEALARQDARGMGRVARDLPHNRLAGVSASAAHRGRSFRPRPRRRPYRAPWMRIRDCPSRIGRSRTGPGISRVQGQHRADALATYSRIRHPLLLDRRHTLSLKRS